MVDSRNVMPESGSPVVHRGRNQRPSGSVEKPCLPRRFAQAFDVGESFPDSGAPAGYRGIPEKVAIGDDGFGGHHIVMGDSPGSDRTLTIDAHSISMPRAQLYQSDVAVTSCPAHISCAVRGRRQNVPYRGDNCKASSRMLC